MLETICTKCGKRYQLGTDHACPKKSTAARMDVQPEGQRGRSVGSEGPLATKGFKSPSVQPAGTQAPPVDTNPPATSLAADQAEPVIPTALPAPPTKRGRGRPKTIEDMRAYKREHERKRRLAKAAAALEQFTQKPGATMERE